MSTNEVSGAQVAVDTQDRYADIVSTDPQVTETPEPKQEPVAKEQEQQPETQTEEQEEAKEERKKKGGYTRKLEKLEAMVASLLEERTVKQNPEPAAKQQEDGRPKIDSYETYEAYYEALAEWKLDQKLSKRAEEESQAKVKQTYQAKVDTFTKKAEEFAKTTPDYEEAITEAEAPMTPALQQALLESEMGPQVAYYLAKNHEEAMKASTMTFAEVNRLIGRIEAKLENASPKEVIKKTTNAPEPIKPVGSGKVAKVWSLDDPDIPYEEYQKLRGKR